MNIQSDFHVFDSHVVSKFILDITDIGEGNIVKNTYIHIHIITPVFPEGLGRGVPMYTHASPVCFRSHVIGGEPIANNRAQILTPSCY